jgi:hypothetical protein|nr:hypothetical protein [Neorhizobium tomejilense]
MYRDTIQNLTDDYLALGARRHTVRYNDFEFQLEVTARPTDRSTNERARKLMALNMEANIRKSSKGLGLGQYLSPEEVKTLQNGQVDLRTIINGKSYIVPVEVTPDGQYSCKLLKSRTHSLKDIAVKIMDGIFEHNGVDNMYRNTSGMRHAIAEQAAQQPRAYGMRM